MPPKPRRNGSSAEKNSYQNIRDDDHQAGEGSEKDAKKKNGIANRSSRRRGGGGGGSPGNSTTKQEQSTLSATTASRPPTDSTHAAGSAKRQKGIKKKKAFVAADDATDDESDAPTRSSATTTAATAAGPSPPILSTGNWPYLMGSTPSNTTTTTKAFTTKTHVDPNDNDAQPTSSTAAVEKKTTENTKLLAWEKKQLRDHERFYDRVDGQIVDYVSNKESMAMSALIWETGDLDILWTVYLSYALFFDWEDWAEREPPHETFFTPTSKLVQRALGRECKKADVILLDGRKLTDISMVWLSEALVLRKELNVVDLSFNLITPKGLRIVLNALRFSDIEGLYLGNNNLGDVGASILADLLKEPKCKVQRLNVSNNNISGAGAKEIMDAVIAAGGRTKQLSFTNNIEIKQPHVDEIHAALKAAEITMQHLDFRGCTLDDVPGTEQKKHGREISLFDTSVGGW